jgi:probable selenium-dependent hydroxylase accessory protein YqeC
VKVDLAKSLCEGLGILAGDAVSIAGAGGKTSLMYGLGRELAAAGHPVLLTTTTKVFYPRDTEAVKVFIGPETPETLSRIKAGLERTGTLLAGSGRLDSKIVGFSAGFVDHIYGRLQSVTVIAECDGAMGKSLKVPREWEPVLPSTTTVYVVVVGADCLGKRVDSESVFRPESVVALTGAATGAEVDARLVARAVLAPGSYAGKKPGRSRFCVFINKWDSARASAAGGRGASGEDPAVALALELKRSAAPVDRVMLGSARPGVAGSIMVIG